MELVVVKVVVELVVVEVVVELVVVGVVVLVVVEVGDAEGLGDDDGDGELDDGDPPEGDPPEGDGVWLGDDDGVPPEGVWLGDEEGELVGELGEVGVEDGEPPKKEKGILIKRI